MKMYRLYTGRENTEGVDFNEDTIIMLTNATIDGINVALLLDTSKSYEPYIVAYALNYIYEDKNGQSLPDNTIDWGQGHYYKDLYGAIKKFTEYKWRAELDEKYDET